MEKTEESKALFVKNIPQEITSVSFDCSFSFKKIFIVVYFFLNL